MSQRQGHIICVAITLATQIPKQLNGFVVKVRQNCNNELLKDKCHSKYSGVIQVCDKNV
jgi:hypothetical protein